MHYWTCRCRGICWQRHVIHEIEHMFLRHRIQGRSVRRGSGARYPAHQLLWPTERLQALPSALTRQCTGGQRIVLCRCQRATESFQGITRAVHER